MGAFRKKVKVSAENETNTLKKDSDEDKVRRIRLLLTSGKDAGEEVKSVKRKGILGN